MQTTELCFGKSSITLVLLLQSIIKMHTRGFHSSFHTFFTFQSFKFHNGTFFWNSACWNATLTQAFSTQGSSNNRRENILLKVCRDRTSSLLQRIELSVSAMHFFVCPVCAPWDIKLALFVSIFLMKNSPACRRIYTNLCIHVGVFSFQSAFSEEWAVCGAHVNSRAYARSLRNKTLFDVLSSTKKHIFTPIYKTHSR